MLLSSNKINIVILLFGFTIYYLGFTTDSISGLSFTTQLIANAPLVTTPDDSTIHAIQGFAAGLRCVINTCVKPATKVQWYKRNQKLSEGLKTFDERLFVTTQSATNQTCTKSCTESGAQNACSEEEFCRPRDFKCCVCTSMEFKLVIHNLTSSDSDTYTCQLDGGNKVSTRLLVIEGAVDPDFSKNFTFDHRKCCKENDMPDTCMPMCQPGLMETHKFETHSCNQEFGKLLKCATNGGNISHEHCCNLQAVPRYCSQYCSGKNFDFSSVNKLCIYYMPEILSCYEHAYLPIPGSPEKLKVYSLNDSALRTCWSKPVLRPETVQYYTVNYQELPQFSFFSGLNLFGANQAPASESDLSPASSESEESERRRKKRQVLYITTHNVVTNETEVREYRYQRINTTGTCLTINNLKPSTRYFIYVTATNSYSTSLPSIKEVAVTQEVSYSNKSMPDVMSCCKKEGVDDACASKMCDLHKAPSNIGAFELAFTCRKEFEKLSPCLADGRDHTECCREKGVFGACLNFCNGSAKQFAMSNVLCLTLDIQAVFSCFKRGYVSLPSPPINVTVYRIDSTSAIVSWSEPQTNRDLVKNVSLFYGAPEFTEIADVKSPYQLTNLRADASYSIYLIARAEKGSSLKSSLVSFQTLQPIDTKVCQYGKPLMDANGRRVQCNSWNRCPSSHICVTPQSDDPNTKYCCPMDTTLFGPTLRVQPPNVTQCCVNKGVSKQCLPLCSYQTTKKDLETLGLDCLDHIQTFLDCGGDGRDNGDCCKTRKISNEVCLDFCTPPLTKKLTEYVDCIEDAETIIYCGMDGVLYRPGPPLNVSIIDQGADWFTVAWKRPSQSVTVKFFEVLVNNVSQANVTGLISTIDGLWSDREYDIKIVARNERGSSMPSEHVKVTLKSSSRSNANNYKPRPPNNIRKTDYVNGVTNVTWDWPNMSVRGNPIKEVEFYVYYIEHPMGNEERNSWKNVTTKNMYVTLNDLNHNQNYDFKVKAMNLEKNIESVFSQIAVINATEIDRTSTVDLWVDPDGYIREGDFVTAHCIAKGDISQKNVQLRQGFRILASQIGSVNFSFGAVTADNGSDPLICLVNNDGQIIQKREILQIRYKPVIENFSPIPRAVNTIQGTSASLLCVVRGFPAPKIEWYNSNDQFKNKRILPDANHFMQSSYSEDQSAIGYSLEINEAQIEDAGSYSCQACNEVGCNVQTFVLLVEALETPYGPEDIPECCKAQNVKTQCMSICLSEEGRLELEEEEECVADFYKYFSCSQASVDSSQCCAFKSVPEICLPYCHLGEMLKGDRDSNENLKFCSTYHRQIISCTQQDHKKYIPHTLKITDVKTIGGRRLNVTWTPADPKDGDVIYILYYKKTNEKNYTRIRTKSPYSFITSVDMNKQYNFTVISKNSYGFSSFSPLVPYTPQLFSDEYGSVEYSSGSSGAMFLIALLLLFVVAVALSVVYFSRRPQKLPAVVLKVLRRDHPAANGAVTFENPGYDTDREGRVHGLPGDPIVPSTNIGVRTVGYANAGYESAQLETPMSSGKMDEQQQQNGSRYSQLLS